MNRSENFKGCFSHLFLPINRQLLGLFFQVCPSNQIFNGQKNPSKIKVLKFSDRVMRSIFFFLAFVVAAFAQDPDILYLTWKDDPSTTMTIVWHTDTGSKPLALFSKSADGEGWIEHTSSVERLCGSPIEIYQSELTNLAPDTEYFFRLDDGPLHRFRTLPDTLDRPLRVAVGGDAYQVKCIFEKINDTVASQSPDFAIVGGDVAYSEGLSTALRTHLWRVERWEEFFRIWTKQMVTSEGRIIPIMSTIGNHDLKEGFDNPMRHKVLYYQMFPLPRKGISYQKMKIGKDVCFFLLDSGHSYPPGGAQAEWLEKELKEEEDTSFKVPVYHIGAYPSETSYIHRGSKDIRKFWCPLFEKYGVKVSIENDNHTFKRTFPIRDGKVDRENGVIYVGDGAWGVTPLKPKRHWYLAKAAQTNCYWLVTFTKEGALYQAFNLEGQLIDELTVEID